MIRDTDLREGFWLEEPAPHRVLPMNFGGITLPDACANCYLRGIKWLRTNLFYATNQTKSED